MQISSMVIDKNGYLIFFMQKYLKVFKLDHSKKKLRLLNKFFFEDFYYQNSANIILEVQNSNLFVIYFRGRVTIISPTDGLGAYEVVHKLECVISTYSQIQYYKGEMVVQEDDDKLLLLCLQRQIEGKNLKKVAIFKSKDYAKLFTRWDNKKQRIYQTSYSDGDKDKIQLQIISKPIDIEKKTREDGFSLDQTLVITREDVDCSNSDALEVTNIFFFQNKSNLTRLVIMVNDTFLIFDEQDNKIQNFKLVSKKGQLWDDFNGPTQIAGSSIFLKYSFGRLNMFDLSEIDKQKEGYKRSIHTVEDDGAPRFKICQETGSLVQVNFESEKPNIKIFLFDRQTQSITANPIDIEPSQSIKEYTEIEDVCYSEDSKIWRFIFTSKKTNKMSVWEFEENNSPSKSKELVCKYSEVNENIEKK